MRKFKKLGIATSLTLAGMSMFAAIPVMAEENTIVLETNAPDTATDSNEFLPDVKTITKQVMPGIVAITAESKETIEFWGRSYEQDSEKAGSGVIIAKTDDELIIATNNHVVEDAEDLTVLFSVDVEDEDSALVPALVKGTDSSLDLAVVSVKLADIPEEVIDQITIVPLGDSSAIDVGDWSIAIGNALGYGQSVTFGIVSALDREITLNSSNGEISNTMIQTDAAINFGNSGGALLNTDGQLIGINSAKASSAGVEGMGYAIPINIAKPVLEDLINQKTRVKVAEENAGVMGINVTDVSEEARQLYNIPAGAYVLEVNPDSAAEAAGMEKGDIIVKVEKTTISSVNELLSRMAYYAAGEEVPITVKHPSDGGYKEVVINVTLQAKEATDDAEELYEEELYEEETEEDSELPDEEFDPEFDNGKNYFEKFFDEFNDDEDKDWNLNGLTDYHFGYWE